jgi:hypothetical protein
LETGHLLGKGLPSGIPPVPLLDEFYALGWGRNSTFAALERRHIDPTTLEVRLRVYDLIEDRVLWEKRWPDWGIVDRETWWESKEPEVGPIFAKWGVEPTQLQLGVFPLILGEEYYVLSFRTEKNSGDPSWIDRLEIAVHSTGRGLKTVREGYGFWRWAALLGFIPSPYESRLALIFLVQPAGWQGANQPLRFFVAGLSLRAGFPKP